MRNKILSKNGANRTSSSFPKSSSKIFAVLYLTAEVTICNHIWFKWIENGSMAKILLQILHKICRQCKKSFMFNAGQKLYLSLKKAEQQTFFKNSIAVSLSSMLNIRNLIGPIISSENDVKMTIEGCKNVEMTSDWRKYEE